MLLQTKAEAEERSCINGQSPLERYKSEDEERKKKKVAPTTNERTNERRYIASDYYYMYYRRPRYSSASMQRWLSASSPLEAVEAAAEEACSTGLLRGGGGLQLQTQLGIGVPRRYTGYWRSIAHH